jgi:hypothetical protein
MISLPFGIYFEYPSIAIGKELKGSGILRQ